MSDNAERSARLGLSRHVFLAEIVAAGGPRSPA